MKGTGTVTLTAGAGLMALAFPLSLGGAQAPASHEPAPICQRVIISENSGNGPTYRVQVCGDGRSVLRWPGAGKRWQLIVDGGPLQDGAVVFGFQVSR